VARLLVTQYGWKEDPYGDTLTREGWGAWGNKLTIDACALTDSAVELIRAKPMDWIKVDFKDGTAPLARQYQDRAPEKEPRCDLYMPEGFNKRFPDYAEVTLVESVS